MFKIDTGAQVIRAQSASIDETQIVRITTHTQAARLTDKIVANIMAHECQDALDAYWQREGLALDALHLYDTHAVAHLTDVYKEHRGALIHGGAYKSAPAVPCQTVSGNPNALIGNTDKGQDYGF